MIKLKEKLSSEIRNKRQELKMSQEELAEKINKTTGFIGQLERGESLPSLDTLQDLVNCLGIDLNVLLANEEVSKDEFDTIYTLMLNMNDNKRTILIEFAKMLHQLQL